MVTHEPGTLNILKMQPYSYSSGVAMSIANQASDVMEEYTKIIIDEIRRELDNEILCEMMRKSGRLEVVARGIDSVAAIQWCSEVFHVASWTNYGDYWFFDDVDDVALFILKWGGQHVR